MGSFAEQMLLFANEQFTSTIKIIRQICSVKLSVYKLSLIRVFFKNIHVQKS